MTSIGTGYDLENSIFSPDGRNFQVEYAMKAVENGGTSVGIRCKNGVVLAFEKIITSKLLKPNANKRISAVDRHCGVVFSGLVPDGKHFVDRARDEAANWRDQWKSPISVADLTSSMGDYVHAYTTVSWVRPFGISAIIAGWNSTLDAHIDGEVGSGPSCGAGGRIEGTKRGGPALYMIEPSGCYWGYYGAATGKGRQAAKAELEKLNLHEQTMDVEKAVLEAARIIYVAHDNKYKEFELEIGWVTAEDGPTKGNFVELPEEMLERAKEYASQEIEWTDDEESDEDKMDGSDDEESDDDKVDGSDDESGEDKMEE